MHISTEESRPTLNIVDLITFELQFGIMLPDDYKVFLLDNNGGKPTPRRYATINGKMESSVVMFYPIEDSENSLATHYNKYLMNNAEHPNLLPIGEDPLQNIICMSLYGHDEGVVYHWNIISQKSENAVPYMDMWPIAESFQQFVGRLFENKFSV